MRKHTKAHTHTPTHSCEHAYRAYTCTIYNIGLEWSGIASVLHLVNINQLPSHCGLHRTQICTINSTRCTRTSVKGCTDAIERGKGSAWAGERRNGAGQNRRALNLCTATRYWFIVINWLIAFIITHPYCGCGCVSKNRLCTAYHLFSSGICHMWHTLENSYESWLQTTLADCVMRPVH